MRGSEVSTSVVKCSWVKCSEVEFKVLVTGCLPLLEDTRII